MEKTLDELTDADLLTLVTIQAPESARLEFKCQINLCTTADKAELAKDVSGNWKQVPQSIQPLMDYMR